MTAKKSPQVMNMFILNFHTYLFNNENYSFLVAISFHYRRMKTFAARAYTVNNIDWH